MGEGFVEERVSAGSDWYLLHASDWSALLMSFFFLTPLFAEVTMYIMLKYVLLLQGLVS